MNVRVIGMDLGKTTFHLIGMDEHGSIVLKKRFSRSQLMKFLANLQSGEPASCLLAGTRPDGTNRPSLLVASAWGCDGGSGTNCFATNVPFDGRYC